MRLIEVIAVAEFVKGVEVLLAFQVFTDQEENLVELGWEFYEWVLWNGFHVSHSYLTKVSVILLYDNIFLVITHFCVVTKEKLKKQIGQRIVDLRTKKGWSQSDLARKLGKDRQAVEKLENGKVNPTLYSLHEIAKALDVKLAVLVEF